MALPHPNVALISNKKTHIPPIPPQEQTAYSKRAVDKLKSTIYSLYDLTTANKDDKSGAQEMQRRIYGSIMFSLCDTLELLIGSDAMRRFMEGEEKDRFMGD